MDAPAYLEERRFGLAEGEPLWDRPIHPVYTEAPSAHARLRDLEDAERFLPEVAAAIAEAGGRLGLSEGDDADGA